MDSVYRVEGVKGLGVRVLKSGPFEASSLGFEGFE